MSVDDRPVPPPPPPPPSPAPPAEPAEDRGHLEEVPHSLSHRVEGLTCPNCGGALELRAGLRVAECPYCGTPLLVLSEIGVRRFTVEPRIDSQRARAVARGWLARGVNKDGRLRREAKVGEAFLTFLPFYRVEADCVGIALGTEERRRRVGSGKRRRTETYEVDVERRKEQSFDRAYPAVNVAEWGIRRVDLRGDPLIPFDSDALDRKGMVFPPTGSERKILEEALAAFREEADPARGLKRVRFRFLETLRERLSVVYYPLWVVRYRFRDRAYQVLVDAEDGSLAYGKAPGNDLYRALMMVATEAVAAFIFTTSMQLWGSFETMLVAGTVALAILAWGWRHFRWGAVVTEGTGATAEESLAGSVRRAIRGGSPGKLIADLANRRLQGIDR